VIFPERKQAGTAALADLVETNNTKSAVLELTTPIATIAAFDAIIESILSDNPFGCVDYVEQGATIPGVKRNRESYTVRVNYEDDFAKTVGSISQRPDGGCVWHAGNPSHGRCGPCDRDGRRRRPGRRPRSVLVLAQVQGCERRDLLRHLHPEERADLLIPE